MSDPHDAPLIDEEGAVGHGPIGTPDGVAASRRKLIDELNLVPLEQCGDLSGDRDVDREDWGLQNDCLEGPAAPIGAGCEEADLNGDGRIDLGDVRLFWELFTGAM